uniref:Uncharacterized protein n=1 Tax=Arundo donax TaxID=35708 RepID=A0A0A9FRW4_ARUDO
MNNALIGDPGQSPERYGRQIPDAIRGGNLDQSFVGNMAAPAAS